MNFDGNYPALNEFQKIIFELFEFDSDDNQFEKEENTNSIIIDCFCEIIRLLSDNTCFVNIIRPCMN